MEPNANSTVSPNLLPDVARYHKQSNERTGPTQIHLRTFNVGVMILTVGSLTVCRLTRKQAA